MGRTRRLLRRLRSEESGFTLVELVTVLVLLLIVMTCLSYAMIAAHKAEEDMNRRFASQINARIALDQLRRDVHCATVVTPGPIGTVSNITMVLGPRCPAAAAGLIVTWCTVGSGTRYALHRQVGLTCGSTGRKVVDYLTTGAIFSYTLQLPTSLAYVSVSLPVNTKPASGRPDYRLADDIVLRNSVRA